MGEIVRGSGASRQPAVRTSPAPGSRSVTQRRRVARLLVAAALGLLAAVQLVYFERGLVPGDAFNYLAAGERLNASRPLYELSPGDRPVDTGGKYWNVPLVSPPPIAVIWRPLAALPNELGVWLWYAAQLSALATSLVLLLRRAPLATAGAMLVLLIPTVYEIGVGNVNSFLLLGLLVAWRTATRGREPVAGAAAAVMAAVKVTPGIVGWWLLVTGRRRGFIAFVVAGLIALAVSLLGAGLDAHLEYLRILGDRSAVGTSPLSVGGMARFVGVPAAVADLMPTAAAVAGAVGILLLRRRAAASFQLAVITMIAGSPAVSINWFILLYALVAPVAWPAGTPQQARGSLGRGRFHDRSAVPADQPGTR